MNIAIDGPAGAGKSSIAKIVAKKLSFIYLDTGAMYRTTAYYFLKNGLNPSDKELVESKCDDINIEIKYEDGAQQVYLNGENVSTEIRNEEVGNNASVVAAYGKVREKLVSLQQSIAKSNDVIMDGRDIGTVVLPDAELKIYLTASSKERASRRFKELTEKGVACDFDKIEQDIIARDEQDMNREISPLKQADDAVLVDSSYMTIDEVVNRILELTEERR